MFDDDYGSTKIIISQSAGKEKIEERIEYLQSKLSVLNEEVQSLVLKENPLYREMLENYNELKANKMNENENWEKNSQNLAQKEYESDIEISENDYNQNREILETRSKMLIKYKFDKLMQTMPTELIDYFTQKNLPFFQKINEVKSFPDDDLSNPPISFTNEPLLEIDDINNDLELLSQQKPKTAQYVVSQRTLKCGKMSFPNGCPVNIVTPENPPFDAIVQSADQSYLTLKLKGSNNVFNISLFALNSGLVSMQKCSFV